MGDSSATTLLAHRSFGGSFGRPPVHARNRSGEYLVHHLEELFVLHTARCRCAIPKGRTQRSRFFVGALLQAAPGGRQKDTPGAAVDGVGLSSNQATLLQPPQDRRYGIRIGCSPFDDLDLSQTALACYDAEHDVLVRRNTVLQHPRVDLTMERKVCLAQPDGELITFFQSDPLSLSEQGSCTRSFIAAKNHGHRL